MLSPHHVAKELQARRDASGAKMVVDQPRVPRVPPRERRAAGSRPVLMGPQSLSAREKAARRAIDRLGTERLLAFFRAIQTDHRPLAAKLLNDDLDAGSTIEAIFLTCESDGFYLEAKVGGDDSESSQLSPDEQASLRSQFVTLDAGRGRHRKFRALAFSEQGVAMLSSVLRSPRAIEVNIEIMRAFVELRRSLESVGGLAQQLEALERKYDGQFAHVFEAIRQLVAPAAARRRKIGFKA